MRERDQPAGNEAIVSSPELTLDQAMAAVTATLRTGRESGLRPLTVAVLDSGGHLKAFAREEGPGGAIRPQIAIGKAFGAVAFAVSSRELEQAAFERPHFMQALIGASTGRIVPVPGGVVIRDSPNGVVGAIGVSGDSSDADEAAALVGARAAEELRGHG